jgi:ferredoxin-type protein NapG
MSNDSDERYDRKSLIQKGFQFIKKYVVDTVEQKLDLVPRTQMRPPGALLESLFLSTCRGGGECAAACPYGTIRMAGPPGLNAETTPTIIPTRMPCYLCTDVPCAAACPSGALVPLKPQAIKIGLAVVDKHACFAWQGSECELCVKACPVGPAALVRFEDKGPKVGADACTGCGICTNVCPARPRAIRIKPL